MSKIRFTTSLSAKVGFAILTNSFLLTKETSNILATNIGISPNVLNGILLLASAYLPNSIHHQFSKVQDIYNPDINHDLEKALINALKRAIIKTEISVKEELNLKYNLIDNLKDLLLEKPTCIRHEFTIPLIESLIDEKNIAKIITNCSHLNAYEFLKNLIENNDSLSSPSFAFWRTNNWFVEFVCTRFNDLIRQEFIQEMKRNEKARVVYFSNLLEIILLNSKNIKENISLLIDFSKQANISLETLISENKDTSDNFKELQNLIISFNSEINTKIKSIKESIEQYLEPQLYVYDYSDNANELNIYNYKYHFLNFIGRESEMSQLLDFINRECKKKFQWWMITGPGGIGKSSLAHNLCFKAIESGYYAGFLDSNNLFKWDAWKPKLPTLIVIDYALSDIKGLISLIKKLMKNSCNFEYNVRLLLVDRSISFEWENDIIYPGNEIYDSQYRVKPIELKTLGVNENLDIIKQVLKKINPCKINDIKFNNNKYIDIIKRIDINESPLFVILISIAFAYDVNLKDYDSFRMLEFILKRHRTVWGKYIQVNLYKEVEYILLINTICGSINANSLDYLRLEFKIKIEFNELKSLYSQISSKNNQCNEELWYGVKPDVLGEFFIFESINRIIKDNPTNWEKILSEIIDKAMAINSINSCNMFFLIWQDYYSSMNNHNFDVFNFLYSYLIKTEDIVSRNHLSFLFIKRARIYANLSNTEKSSFDVNKAKLLGNNNLSILFKSIYLKILMGNIGEASLWLKNILSNNPSDKYLLILNSIINYLNGQIDKDELEILIENVDNKSLKFDLYSLLMKIDLLNKDINGENYFANHITKVIDSAIDSNYEHQYIINNIFKLNLFSTEDVTLNDLDSVSKAIESNPINASLYIDRGILKFRQGNFLDAIEDFETSNLIEPTFTCSRYLIFSKLFQKVGYLEIIYDIKNFIKLFPEKIYFHELLIEILLDNNEYEKALIELNESLLSSPKYAELKNIRGKIYIAMGDFKNAYSDFMESATLGYIEAMKNLDIHFGNNSNPLL